MQTEANVIESLIGKTEQYANTRYELTKLKAIENTTEIASTVISRLGIMLHIMLFLLFVNIGLAILLGDMLGKMCYGFFIVGAFHLLLSVVLYFFLYRWVKKPVSHFIITQVLR
jgi:hypothetical protein